MKVEYVCWEDAVAISEWTDSKEIEDLRPSKIESIGYVLKESEECLIISCAVCEEESANAIMVIPKGWIKKRIEIEM